MESHPPLKRDRNINDFFPQNSLKQNGFSIKIKPQKEILIKLRFATFQLVGGTVIRATLGVIQQVREYLQLPGVAKAERRRDRAGLPSEDPGTKRVIDCGVAWLALAQDRSTSQDGGVARHFSLVSGWGPSYPETTGYIVSTMLLYAQLCCDAVVRGRAKRMLDWLVSIQFPEGGFQAGTILAKPPVPATFNTGQILLGLASGVAEFGEPYRDAMCRAADWLVRTQDPDGCWRKHPTRFAGPGEKAYETHVALGLLEAACMEPHKGYAEAALANVRWALTKQRENGWIDDCCLGDRTQPLTHTLGYALRGIVEAYRFSSEPMLLTAARKTADGLLSALNVTGFLPGRLDAQWRGTVTWACLTGTVQVAHCWLILYDFTSDPKYREAALAANRFVRRTIKVAGPAETCGAVKGSYPVNGPYGKYEFLNWACKFCVDSNIAEEEMRRHEKPENPGEGCVTARRQ